MTDLMDLRGLADLRELTELSGLVNLRDLNDWRICGPQDTVGYPLAMFVSRVNYLS